MANYVIDDQFWTGETGKEIKRIGGKCAQLMAIYMMTNVEANRIGLYYFSIDKAMRFLDLTREESEIAISTLEKVDFCKFDNDSGLIYVKNMAGYQIGFNLKHNDARQHIAKNELEKFAQNEPLVQLFVSDYKEHFHIETAEVKSKPHEVPRNVRQTFINDLVTVLRESKRVDLTKLNINHPIFEQLFMAGVPAEFIRNEIEPLYHKKNELLPPALIATVALSNYQKNEEVRKSGGHKAVIGSGKGEYLEPSKEIDNKPKERSYSTNIEVIQ